jgi:hypothetical protein
MWKAIEGTNGMIEVSDDGRVRSLLRGEPYVLKTQPDKKGYHRLRITINREKMSFKLHREVAKAFIPNPENLPQVNHMDGNKGNNAVSNLEWCTNQQNQIHAVEMSWGNEKMSVNDIDYSLHKINRKRPTARRTHEVPRECVRKRAERKPVQKHETMPRRKRGEWNNPNPKKPIIGYFNGEEKRFASISEAEQFLSSRHISDVLKGKRSHVKGWSFEYVKGGGECDTDVTRT